MLNQERTAPMKNLVLYIEDNADNIVLVEELLSRRAGLQLISSRTGEQGIVLASTREPDLILMDINLPDMSGLDALKYLRDHSETAHIPVIALSSHAFPHHIERGMEAGFFCYLTKPFRIDEFMVAVDACLKQSAAKHPAPPGPALAACAVPVE
jgi:CheY-like chemotaxis protein